MLTDYDGQRICGVPDHLGTADCRWPMVDVTVFAAGAINGVNLAEAAELAIKGWNDVCGLRLTMSVNPKTANIVTGPRSLDGQGNVLAQCQLPCGFVSPSAQMGCDVDLSEAFVIGTNPPAGKIDLVRVLMHEYGHGIGIPHIASGNLMAPVYSASIRLPQDGDIVQARSRYGMPAPVAPVPPTVPAPSVPGSPQLPTGFRLTALEATDALGNKFRTELDWKKLS